MTEGVLVTSRYIAFLDESGDHSLIHIDPDFPLFVLCTVIIERSLYASTIVPRFAAIKLKYFAHEGINFHSREIRKAIGAFSVLQNAPVRESFLNDVTELIRTAPFHLFVTAIDKRKLSARYGRAAHNPYDIALKLTFERVLYFLRRQNERMLPIVAEARGRKEDAELQAGFYELITEGRVSRSRGISRTGMPVGFSQQTRQHLRNSTCRFVRAPERTTHFETKRTEPRV